MSNEHLILFSVETWVCVFYDAATAVLPHCAVGLDAEAAVLDVELAELPALHRHRLHPTVGDHLAAPHRELGTLQLHP